MTEQIEKLINSILHSYIIRNLDETILIEPNLVKTQILQACKEAELKFVPKDWLVLSAYDKDRAIKSKMQEYEEYLIKAINSQIKELK